MKFLFLLLLPFTALADDVRPSHTLLALEHAMLVACPGGSRVYAGYGSDFGYFQNGQQGVMITQTSNPQPYLYTLIPGDTVVLKNTDPHRTYFTWENVHGTPGCPITIINEVTNPALGPTWVKGFEQKNCTYINTKGVGGGTALKYGYHLEDVGSHGPSINFHQRSSNLEICNFEFYGSGYIAWFKQDLICNGDTTWNYPNTINDSSSIHDFTARNVGQDGIYWDNTSSNGYDPCGGSNIQYPQHSKHGRIYNGIIDSLNRTAIQVSACDSCELYNNVISNAGFEYNQSQGAGISIGSQSTHSYVHDNTIKLTFAPGIFILGYGQHKIYNNHIDSTGMLRCDPTLDMTLLIANLDANIHATNSIWNTGFYHLRSSGQILYNTYSQPSGFYSDPTRDALSDPAVLPYRRHPYDSTTILVVNNVIGESITITSTYDITHNVNANRFRVIDDGVSNKYGFFNYQCNNVMLEDFITPIAIANVNNVHIFNTCPPDAPPPVIPPTPGQRIFKKISEGVKNGRGILWLRH